MVLAEVAGLARPSGCAQALILVPRAAPASGWRHRRPARSLFSQRIAQFGAGEHERRCATFGGRAVNTPGGLRGSGPRVGAVGTRPKSGARSQDKASCAPVAARTSETAHDARASRSSQPRSPSTVHHILVLQLPRSPACVCPDESYSVDSLRTRAAVSAPSGTGRASTHGRPGR